MASGDITIYLDGFVTPTSKDAIKDMLGRNKAPQYMIDNVDKMTQDSFDNYSDIVNSYDHFDPDNP